MQNFLRKPTSIALGLRSRPGFTALAVLVLSLGVGATTALFGLVDGVMPRSVPEPRCETVMKISDDAGSAAFRIADVPSRAELRKRVSDAYESSMESAGDALDALPDAIPAAGGASFAMDALGALSALGPRPTLALLGAFALGFLLLCTRAASRMAISPRVPAVAIATAVGALTVAALALRALDLPPIGVRTVAFALCISFVAVFFARFAQKRDVPLTI